MAIIDIPSTLIQTIIEFKEDKVIIFTRGKLADIVIVTAPEV